MVKPVTIAEQEALGLTTLLPHPDGKPWGKCCGEKGDKLCMCLMRKPKNDQSRFDLIMGEPTLSSFAKNSLVPVVAENGRFFCVHRKTDDGFHRECAGWAAKFGHK